MRKSTVLKTVFQFLSLLLCLVLIPAVFAQPEELGGSTTYENRTYEKYTILEQEVIGGDYTVHYIDPTYYSAFIMPGDSETFNVSFRNEGSETLNIAPKVVATPYGYYHNINESWITISPANVSVSPGVKQDFTVVVCVPEDAEIREYNAQVAFTDDIYPDDYIDPIYIHGYPDDYINPQYVNAMYIGISVPVRPKLELQTSYISDIIEAGKEYVYSIKIKNLVEKDVTIDPKVVSYDMYDYSFSEPAFSEDIIEVSAPSTIKAGEITNMIIRIPVPENATGSYNAFIEMNADGKENDGSVPQISLSFTVGKQTSVPYVKTFNTTTAGPITIEISTAIYDTDAPRISPEKKMPNFEVNLKCNSIPVNTALVKATESGTVYIQGYSFPIWAMKDGSSYESYNEQYIETYKASGAIGAWELTILPKNTDSFDYSITVGESE
ncbi:MAG: hypothetical protein PHC39_10355 [Proteiniphilum sp.]|jgi:hypothetical protein|nr:hypothetical protein [Proteiniphilum sp.]HHV23739.1 hypothetical protein [Methanosarcina sp.]